MLFRRRSGIRSWLLGGLCGVLTLSLAACGGQSPAAGQSSKPASAPASQASASKAASGSPAAAQPAAPNHITTIRAVLSHSTILLEYAPYFVAMDKGFFKNHGVRISIVSGGGGGATLRILSAGGVDLAQGGVPAALLSALKDPHVEMIAGFENINEFTWLVPANSKVHSVKDLAGAKLAYSHAGSATSWTLHAVAKRANIPNVTFVSCGGPGACWAAAKSGAITAAWGSEPFASLMEQTQHARVVLRAADYVKHYVLDAVDVNKHFADTHSQAIRGFLAALQEGIDFVQAHPNQAAQITAKHLKMSDAVVKEGLKKFYAISKTPWQLNLLKDPAGVKTVEQGMISQGQLKHLVSISTVLDTKYLPAQTLK